MYEKSIDRKRSIGEIAKEIDLPSHVIRFWESKFPDKIKPIIGKGERRYYFEKDVEMLKKIKTMLYDEGYTIFGLQKFFKKRQRNQTEKIELNHQEQISELIIKIENNLQNWRELLTKF